MKAKKVAKHAAVKAAKPAPKKKVVAKAPAVKAAIKKSKPSVLSAAASRLKKVLGGKKAAPAPIKAKVNKPVAAPIKPAPKPSKPVSKMHQKTSSIIAPKGLMTEPQLRRMSDRDYMNDVQLLFFRHKLLEMRQEVLDREVEVKERLHEREVFADPADRATAEEEHWLDLRLRERESLLLRKIDDALRRIEAKEFGYCEKTGDPIGIPRLLARPTATVCVDVKGQDERVEAQFRDR